MSRVSRTFFEPFMSLANPYGMIRYYSMNTRGKDRLEKEIAENERRLIRNLKFKLKQERKKVRDLKERIKYAEDDPWLSRYQ